MRGRLPRILALPLTAAVLVLPAVPALAQGEPDLPTTPRPQPADPNQPPVSEPIGPQPTGHAVGAAGTALGILRLLPESVPTKTILPGYSDKLPKQALFEAGLGLTTARANSEAYLSYERSIAQASPGGIALKGDAPQTPGTVVQTALPDNPEPRTGGFNAPPNPLADVGLLNGKAHARWSPTLGPCVGTIADASMSLASLSLLPEIPSFGSVGELIPTDSKLSDALGKLAGPLSKLGGLLSGADAAKNDAASGGLISLPNTMSTRSTVRLIDMPGTENQAVQSVSTMQMADVHILNGTPLGLTVKVVSQPTLTVTSTGSAKTSSVEYTAPVLGIYRDGEKIFTLDAAHPTKNIPIGIPTNPAELAKTLGLPGPEALKDVPIIGGLAETAQGAAKPLTSKSQDFVLDIGVLKLSIAQLDAEKRAMTKPFKGYQLGASARMLNVEVLPTSGLKKILPAEQQKKLPSSLAQISFGEQIARAYAPEGGVTCGTIYPPGPPAGGGEAPGVPDELAYTSAAYSTVPLFWSGTGLLLAGVVMVSALPGRRRETETKTSRPSPHPRD